MFFVRRELHTRISSSPHLFSRRLYFLPHTLVISPPPLILLCAAHQQVRERAHRGWVQILFGVARAWLALDEDDGRRACFRWISADAGVVVVTAHYDDGSAAGYSLPSLCALTPPVVKIPSFFFCVTTTTHFLHPFVTHLHALPLPRPTDRLATLATASGSLAPTWVVLRL